MQTFLRQVASNLYSKHHHQLKDLCIVFPSRRATVYFQKHLSQLIENNSWSPLLFSLEDFISIHAKLVQLDQVDLIFDLYTVHKKIEGSKRQEFDEFLSWATVLLQDFNELDRHLVSAEDLYDFLSEAKAIESWQPQQNELSEFQYNYLRFWRSLKTYYQEFREILLSKKAAHQGLLFRKVAEESVPLVFKHQICYFVGFNALTKAESVFIEKYLSNNSSFMIYDSDDFYVQNQFHQAGHFLRKNLKHPKAITINDKGFSKTKKIRVYGIAGNIAQAKLCGDLLHSSKSDQTAVVLADEQLLIPVLDAVPESIEDINVTMGYPISSSIYYDVIQKIILLHGQAEKIKGASLFSTQLLSALVKHPVWQLFDANVISENQKIKQQIEGQYISSFNSKDLYDFEEKLQAKIFNCQSPQDLIEALSTLSTLITHLLYQKDSLDFAIAQELQKGLTSLKARLEQQKEEVNWKALQFIFQQLISTSTVSFIGEPIMGLQIMGVLESRNLDFDHIILTSVNEGILPSGKSQNSFIPYDIKRKFGLPSYQEKDSIFSYHFFRLLQRAEHIDIIYNTQVDALMGGEKSRFINQLIEELPRYNPSVDLSVEEISFKFPERAISKPIISKSDQLIQLIKERFETGISASAINSYLQCPLDFYYRYLLKLREEESSSTIEISQFGTIVHDALEMLYAPLVGKDLQKEHLHKLKDRIDESLVSAFEKKFKNKPDFGFMMLAYEVAKQYLHRIVNLDIDYISTGNTLKIIALEKQIKHCFDLENGISVQFNGFIDRIDECNGVSRIIDYKTGKVEARDLKINHLDQLLDGSKSIALQVILYKAATEKQFPNSEVGVLSLKTRDTKFLEPEIQIHNGFNSYSELVNQILEHIYTSLTDKTQPFSHNEVSKYCSFCT